jgi:hypothetical protein
MLDCNKNAILNAVGSADVLAERIPEVGPGARMVEGTGGSSSMPTRNHPSSLG